MMASWARRKAACARLRSGLFGLMIVSVEKGERVLRCCCAPGVDEAGVLLVLLLCCGWYCWRPGLGEGASERLNGSMVVVCLWVCDEKISEVKFEGQMELRGNLLLGGSKVCLY